MRGQEPLTASMLAAAPLKEQKQLLGTRHDHLTVKRCELLESFYITCILNLNEQYGSVEGATRIVLLTVNKRLFTVVL